MPKHKRKRRKPRTPTKFSVGQLVRVRPGIRDEQHPDIPLGGWAGAIAEVDGHGMCLVKWSRETLANTHPICRKRCAIEGTEFGDYWLPENELEADPGGPLDMEQPAQITPRPLSTAEQGDRVRMVFGLTSDDFLPRMDEDSLETYYDHLAQRLSLPMEAKYWEEIAPFQESRRNVKVVALDREMAWDEDEGIFCKIVLAQSEEVVSLAELEFGRSSPNYQLVDDYCEWFSGNLGEDEDDEDSEDEDWDDEDSDEDIDDEDGGDEPGEEDPDPLANVGLMGHCLAIVALPRIHCRGPGIRPCDDDLGAVVGGRGRRRRWIRTCCHGIKNARRTVAADTTIPKPCRRLDCRPQPWGNLRRNARGLYRRRTGRYRPSVVQTIVLRCDTTGVSRLERK